MLLATEHLCPLTSNPKRGDDLHINNSSEGDRAESGCDFGAAWTTEFTFNDGGDSLSAGGNAGAQQFVLCSFKSFLCQVQVSGVSPGSGPLSPSHKRQQHCSVG